MYKDFDDEQFKIDEQFMTNADTPSLALSGIIENPINPFTGNPIDSSKKQEGVQKIFVTDKISIKTNNGKTFLPGKYLNFRVGNYFDPGNWSEYKD